MASVCAHLVGFHASAAGCPSKAIHIAAAAGAKAVAFFTRSARTWTCPPLHADAPQSFADACRQHGFQPHAILPHGSYLINVGTADPVIREKSLSALTDEVSRCRALGLTAYNFHPGSAGGDISVEDACKNVAEAINLVHAAVPGRVAVVVEMMAGGGRVLGSNLAEIAAMVRGVADQSRVGVCVDTAHIHAAGYDIRTSAGWARFMEEFESTVGLRYLRGLHLNDSRAELDSRRDRHANIGCGYIGVEAFRAIMNDPRAAGIPLILETPGPEATSKGGDADSGEDGDEVLPRRTTSKAAEEEKRVAAHYRQEIQLLYSLVGTDAGAPLTVQPVSAVSQCLPPSKVKAKKIRGKAAAEVADVAPPTPPVAGLPAAAAPVQRKSGKRSRALTEGAPTVMTPYEHRGVPATDTDNANPSRQAPVGARKRARAAV